MKVWIKSVVLLPFVPPLKTVIGAVTGDRFLFGEGDLDLPAARAYDRAAADVFRRLRVPCLELATLASWKAGRVDRAVLVEVDGRFSEGRRMNAFRSRDLALDANGYRASVAFGNALGVTPPSSSRDQVPDPHSRSNRQLHFLRRWRRARKRAASRPPFSNCSETKLRCGCC